MSPPKWAPHAIATEQGWVNPKTKELLISIKGLKSKLEALQPSVILEIENTVDCPVENTFVEITTEEMSTEVKLVLEPVSEETVETVELSEKRKRGRPKTNKSNA